VTKDYLVFVEACDYVEVEASDEDNAKRAAVDTFKNNPAGAAFNAEIMRSTDETGKEEFPNEETPVNSSSN
jgi:hypothetical protein